jgi:hypothetical protein
VWFQSLEFSIVYEIYDDLDSPEFEYPTIPKPSLGVATQHSSSMGSYSSNTSDNANKVGKVGKFMCGAIAYL